VALAVAQFALIGLVAMVIVGIAAALMLRDVGRSEAIDDAKRLTTLAGRAVVAPALSTAALSGDAQAVARLDRLVRTRLIGDSIVRVKLWRPDGTIVYSDDHRLIGSRYALDTEDLETLRRWTTAADVSDLTRPENRYERSYGKLLEVYFPIVGPGHAPLLFEAYLPFSSISATANERWRTLLPALIGALAALWLVQLPLAYRLARRLQRGQQERERLLEHAIESSNLERRRIAADLHDGPVQDLAGVAFSLAASAQANRGEVGQEREALRRGARETQRTIRQLRALLVDLYPPSLHSAGLHAALSDLVSPLGGQGLTVELDLDDDLDLPHAGETLLFRVAQESLRNVVRHADASHVRVQLRGAGGRAVLAIEDDGHGFETAQPPADGHVGLALLDGLVRDAGGELRVRSTPGQGTRVEAEVALR
jgi:signal transduction histidine kinase